MEKSKEFNAFIDENGSFISGTRKCVDCGEVFEISSHEISHFYAYDQSIPKRCKPCREKRKKARYNN